MLFRTRGGSAAFTFLAAAAALAAAAVASASCATQGKGTNETFNDGSADGTQAEASGSSSGGSGSSSGTGSSSGGSSGCDADTASDPFNCGSCGNHCPTGNICNCATCMAPCGGGMATCCSGCADLMTDPQNCGVCSNTCGGTGTGDVAGSPKCTGGQCEFICPDAGPEGGPVISCGADAGGPGCFNPQKNPQACGGCGNVCASGSCVGGVCQDASVSTTGYTTSTPTVPFLDACSMPNNHVVLQSSFGWTTTNAQFLPFPFTFFATGETEFWIGSQGTLAFGASGAAVDGFPSCSVPDPFDNYPAIVAFGDTNLNTGTSGVCWAQTGAPDAGGDAGANDQLVVTWEQATDSTEPGSVLTFSIVLTQGTNTIDFQYETMLSAPDGGIDPTVAGGTSSVGMQLSNTTHDVYSCNMPFIMQTPLDVRFTPQ